MMFMLSAQVKPLLRLAAESHKLVLYSPDRGVALVGSDGSVLACSTVLAAASPWLRRSLIAAPKSQFPVGMHLRLRKPVVRPSVLLCPHNSPHEVELFLLGHKGI
jgi:hypothetical protein